MPDPHDPYSRAQAMIEAAYTVFEPHRALLAAQRELSLSLLEAVATHAGLSSEAKRLLEELVVGDLALFEAIQQAIRAPDADRLEALAQIAADRSALWREVALLLKG